MSMHTFHDSIYTASSVNYRGRGFTPDLWNNIPFPVIRDNPGLGFTFFDDFIGTHTGTTTTGVGGAYTLTAIAGTPTIAMDNAHGGTVTATAAAATDTHGFIINPGSATAACVTPAAGRILAFEILVKQTLQTVTLGSSFIGLATQAQGMTTTGALTATNYIGFQVLDTDDLKFTYLNSGATLYVDSTKITDVVSAQWYRLGFVIDGLNSVTPYINGSRLSTIAVTSTKSMPDDIMNLTWQAVSGGGTGTPTMTVDWWRFACYEQPNNSIIATY
jgi:hypothetical protein